MSRPTSILGLTAAVLRAQGLLHPVLGVIAAIVLASVALVARRVRDPSDLMREARVAFAARDAPSDEYVSFDDPTMIATPAGWLLAWVRWDLDHHPAVQVAALDRAGTLRGAPATLTTGKEIARHPHLARGAHGNALVWTASRERVFDPRVWFTVLDDDARTLRPARRVGAPDDEGIDPHVASDSEGWGVGWSRMDRTRGYTLARLTGDGASRGEPTHIDDPHGWLRSALVWNGSAWLVAQAERWRETDESAVRLTWIDRGGRAIGRRDLSRWRGDFSDIVATARGASTWITWGEDMGFGPRHDPRVARVDDRTIAQGPRPLGPRRSGSVPAVACASDGCTLAWAAVRERGGNHSEFYVQRVDVNGEPRAPPRSVGPAELARPWSSAALATFGDTETLAVWNTVRPDRCGLLVARLGADGVPLDRPRELPLR